MNSQSDVSQKYLWRCFLGMCEIMTIVRSFCLAIVKGACQVIMGTEKQGAKPSGPFFSASRPHVVVINSYNKTMVAYSLVQRQRQGETKREYNTVVW